MEVKMDNTKRKPWKLPEGFAIGGVLVAVGFLMQWGVGAVDWNVFSWPVNIIVLSVFVLVIVVMHLLRKKVYLFRFIGQYQAAIPSLVYAVVLTIIMGLTRQEANGTWLNNMLSFWPFVLIYVYIALILGVIILKRLRTMFNGQRSMFNGQRSMFNDIPFLLNHFGLFLALTTATLGNADIQRVKMIAAIGEPEGRALDSHGVVKEMPITIELQKFIMETYDDGSPRRFASEIKVLTKTGKNIETVVDVNKPIEVDGWKIYQYGYDTQMGAQSEISIFVLVRDPWLPAVYTGIYMMLAGALCMFVKGGRKRV